MIDDVLYITMHVVVRRHSQDIQKRNYVHIEVDLFYFLNLYPFFSSNALMTNLFPPLKELQIWVKIFFE